MRSLHIGSAMIDTVTLVAPEDIERASFSNDGKSFLMLETGRKVPAKSITWHVGGGACNTAVSLARRGWAAAVTAKTGDDPAADEVRRHLDDEGIEARLIEAQGKATGKAVMIASHDRNASIFVHRGRTRRSGRTSCRRAGSRGSSWSMSGRCRTSRPTASRTSWRRPRAPAPWWRRTPASGS